MSSCGGIRNTACTGQLEVQHTVVDVAWQASLSSISKGGTLGRGSTPGAAPGASGMPGIGMGMPGWAAGLAGSAGCAAGLAGSAGCAAGLAGSAPGIISSVTGAWILACSTAVQAGHEAACSALCQRGTLCSASRARSSRQCTVQAEHARRTLQHAALAHVVHTGVHRRACTHGAEHSEPGTEQRSHHCPGRHTG